MPKSKQKSASRKKHNYFWLYFLVAALAGTLGVFLMPIWGASTHFWKDWGTSIFELILCCLLITYTFLFFVPRVKKTTHKSLRTMWILEMGILLVLSLLCLLGQFGVLSFITASLVFGISFWLRGLFHVLRAYLFEGKQRTGYPLFLVVMALFLMTAGIYLVLRPIRGTLFLWTVSLALLILAAVSLIQGFLSIPKKKADK